MDANKATITMEEARRQELAEDLRFFAKEIEYFETHDISEELENSPEVHFEVSPQIRRRRYPLDVALADQLDGIANQRGVSPETLLNEWVREKTAETETVGRAK